MPTLRSLKTTLFIWHERGHYRALPAQFDCLQNQSYFQCGCHPPQRSYFDLFEGRAASDPNAIALIEGDRLCTFHRLLARALAWSKYLTAVGRSQIGIMCEPSIEAAAAQLGIWGAGKAFTHLDPHYPNEYLRLLLK
ncbi:MAG TPA: AMP-binding protein, partial [Bacteroidota bacterium]|nr:AMP-binding protein [Bacteroidota bacterium]